MTLEEKGRGEEVGGEVDKRMREVGRLMTELGKFISDLKIDRNPE